MTRPFPHGIDLHAPDGIDRLLDFHRATFGDAVMRTNPEAPPAPPADPPAGDPPPNDPPAGDPPAGDPPADPDNPPGADALGDPGKRALDAMKAQRDAEKQKRRQLEQQLATLTAPKPGDELTPEQLREQIRNEERQAIRTPLLKAEIRGLAATLGANDPSDVHLFLKLEEFDANADGEFDHDEINDKLTELKDKKPWLFKNPQPGNPATVQPPKVGAPPAHGNPPKAPTLDEQIASATAAGNFSLVVKLQNQKLANVEQPK